MYGTVARVRMKPGAEARLPALLKEFESRKVPGFIAEYFFRLDNDPNEYMLVAIFQDKASYFANAESPEQDQFYRKFIDLLQGEPQWHDGEIVQSLVGASKQAMM